MYLIVQSQCIFSIDFKTMKLQYNFQGFLIYILLHNQVFFVSVKIFYLSSETVSQDTDDYHENGTSEGGTGVTIGNITQ